MSFNLRQNIPSTPFFVSSTYRDKIDENGFATSERVDDSAPLPPPENFDLRVLLRAGVDVKKVQTRVLGQSAVLHQMIEQFDSQSEPSTSDNKE